MRRVSHGSCGQVLRTIRPKLFGVAVAVGLISAAVAAGAPPAGASSWSVVTSPNPSGSLTTTLSAVACPSTKSCFAVGSAVTGGVLRPLAARWNGSTWGIVPSPIPSSASGAALAGVTCPNTKSCFAVGSFTTRTATETLVEHWNGVGWGLLGSINVTTFNALNAVTCASTKSCFAVGNYASGTMRTLVEHWNGSAWGVMPSPNPSGSTSASLRGVACPTTKSCFAVGTMSNASGAHTLGEHYNGSGWGVLSEPPAAAAVLAGVACPTAKSCFAVGNASVKNIIEHWNGTGWGSTSAPNPPSVDHLSGVACPSRAICFAVGDNNKVFPQKALTLRYA